MASDPAFKTVFTRASLKSEIWNNLPVWFLYLEALALLHFTCANVPRTEFARLGLRPNAFALTAVFPLAWAVAFYFLRVRESSRLREFGARRYLIPLVMAAAPALLWGFYRLFPFMRMELSASSMRVVFEFMQLAWIFVLAWHVLDLRGPYGLLVFYGAGLLYGLILENGGIIMRYFEEPDYIIYLGALPAPLATMLGWCLAFYVSVFVAEAFGRRFPNLTRSPFRAALLTTAVAISIDLQIDPLASLSGLFWKWNPALPPAFLSVPLVNYVAWFSAFLPFAWVYFSFQRRMDISPFMRNIAPLRVLLNVCAAAGVLFFSLMAIFEVGFSGPAYQVLSAFLEKVIPY